MARALALILTLVFAPTAGWAEEKTVSPLSKDSAWVGMLREVTDRLFRHLPEVAHGNGGTKVPDFDLFIAYDDSINMYFLREPKDSDGTKRRIVANIGALRFFQTADELAHWLGHELGHLFQGENGDPRKNELDANRFGVRLMSAAGYNPKGAVRVSERVGKLSRTERVPTWLKVISSHPGMIEDARLMEADIVEAQRDGLLPKGEKQLESFENLPYNKADLDTLSPFGDLLKKLEGPDVGAACIEIIDHLQKISEELKKRSLSLHWDSIGTSLIEAIERALPKMDEKAIEAVAEKFKALPPFVSGPYMYGVALQESVDERWNRLVERKIGERSFRISMESLMELRTESSVRDQYERWLQYQRVPRDGTPTWDRNPFFLDEIMHEERSTGIPAFTKNRLIREWLRSVKTAKGLSNILGFLKITRAGVVSSDIDAQTRQLIFRRGIELWPFKAVSEWIGRRKSSLFSVYHERKRKTVCLTLGSPATPENVELVESWLDLALKGETLQGDASARLIFVKDLIDRLHAESELNFAQTGFRKFPPWYVSFLDRLSARSVSLYPDIISDPATIFRNWLNPSVHGDSVPARGEWLLSVTGSLTEAVAFGKVVEHGENYRFSSGVRTLLRAYLKHPKPRQDFRDVENDLKSAISLIDLVGADENAEKYGMPVLLKILNSRTDVGERRKLVQHIRETGLRRWNMSVGHFVWQRITPFVGEYVGTDEFRRELSDKTSSAEARIDRILREFLHPSLEEILRNPQSYYAEVYKPAYRRSLHHKPEYFGAIDADLRAQWLSFEVRRGLLEKIWPDGAELPADPAAHAWIWEKLRMAETTEEKVAVLTDTSYRSSWKRSEDSEKLQSARESTLEAFRIPWIDYDPRNPPPDYQNVLFEMVRDIVDSARSPRDLRCVLHLLRNMRDLFSPQLSLFPGSKNDRNWSEVQRRLFEKWKILRPGDAPHSAFLNIVTLGGLHHSKGEPLPTSFTDSLLMDEIVPPLEKESPRRLAALVHGEKTGGKSPILSDLQRQTLAKKLLLTFYRGSPGAARTFIEALYPNPNHLREELIQFYTRKAALDRTQLDLFETMRPKGIEGSLLEALAIRSLWPAVESTSFGVRHELVLWLNDLDTLKPGGEAEKLLYGKIQEVNRNAGVVVLGSPEELKRSYIDLSPEAKIALLYPVLYDAKGLILHPEYRKLLRGQFLGIAAHPTAASPPPKEILALYEVLLDSLDPARLALFYGTILPELEKYKTQPELLARRVFELFGAVGVKAMQILSETPGWLPDSYRKAFENSKEAAMPIEKQVGLALLEKYMNTPGARQQIDKMLPGLKGKAHLLWQDVFEVGPELGSASIKVVYSGRLRDGRNVAIKIRRKGIENQIDADISFAERALERLRTKGKYSALETIFTFVMTELRRSLGKEVKFTNEAENTKTLRENRATWERRLIDIGLAFTDPTSLTVRIRVPEIYIATDEFIVESEARGVSLSDPEALQKAGLDRPKVVRAILREVLLQLFVDEFVDPDRHGGNMKDHRKPILPLDDLWMFDLGQAFRVKPEQRRQLTALLRNIAEGSPAEIAASWLRFLDLPDAGKAAGFSRQVTELAGKSGEAGKRNAGKLFWDLLTTTGAEKITFRDGYFNIFKTLNYLHPYVLEQKAYAEKILKICIGISEGKDRLAARRSESKEKAKPAASFDIKAVLSQFPAPLQEAAVRRWDEKIKASKEPMLAILEAVVEVGEESKLTEIASGVEETRREIRLVHEAIRDELAKALAAKGYGVVKIMTGQIELIAALWMIETVKMMAQEGLLVHQAMVKAFRQILEPGHLASLGVFAGTDAAIQVIGRMAIVQTLRRLDGAALEAVSRRVSMRLLTKFLTGFVAKVGLGAGLIAQQSVLDFAKTGSLNESFSGRKEQNLRYLRSEAAFRSSLSPLGISIPGLLPPSLTLFSDNAEGAQTDLGNFERLFSTKLEWQTMDASRRAGHAFRSIQWTDLCATFAILSVSGVVGHAVMPVPVFGTAVMLGLVGVLEGIYQEARYGLRNAEDLERWKKRALDSRGRLEELIRPAFEAANSLNEPISPVWVEDLLEPAIEEQEVFHADLEAELIQRLALAQASYQKLLSSTHSELAEIALVHKHDTVTAEKHFRKQAAIHMAGMSNTANEGKDVVAGRIENLRERNPVRVAEELHRFLTIASGRRDDIIHGPEYRSSLSGASLSLARKVYWNLEAARALVRESRKRMTGGTGLERAIEVALQKDARLRLAAGPASKVGALTARIPLQMILQDRLVEQLRMETQLAVFEESITTLASRNRRDFVRDQLQNADAMAREIAGSVETRL